MFCLTHNEVISAQLGACSGNLTPVMCFNTTNTVSAKYFSKSTKNISIRLEIFVKND